MTKIVHCPQCDKAVPWNEDAKWRPFCSQRCKLIDLGDWAAENHRIAGSPSDITSIGLDDDNHSDYH
jgi:endogenous inhibitor of DNA gyrase (YacG/DUF329 family)